MNNFNNLDLNIIKNKISEFTPILEAKSFINDEIVSFNPLVIKNNLKETKEALKLLNNNFSISFDGIYNINHLLKKADKNITLEPHELRDILVFHNHSSRIKTIFSKIDEDLTIKDYSESLIIDKCVFDQIDRCIDNAGNVKDDATEKLVSINSELNKLEKDLYNKAHTFIDRNMSSLQENSIYIRNDRVTFLIKNSDKNKFQGYTYGSSASGLAYYVEPQSFIELNNKKISLLKDKEDEIDRILKHLSYLIMSISEPYSHNFESLMKLSVVFAKASYGYQNHAIIASVNDTMYFDF